MNTLYLYISALSIILSYGCNSGSGKPVNPDSAYTIPDTPRSFVKNYGKNDTTRLFAFVGEKISVETLPQTLSSMDNGFIAKYRVVEAVYGKFPSDTIEFIAYDHYGTPPFSKFKNVLLYVSADSGTYYHKKYQYNDVYQTSDGRWAGTYHADDFDHPYIKRTNIKPVKIEFADKVSFPLKEVIKDSLVFEYSYPKPYYKTIGDSAYPLYGLYLEDLFSLKKTGIFTGWGMFQATEQQEEDMVESFQPEPKNTPPTADDLKFLRFWKKFVDKINQGDLNGFQKIALDTLYVCDKLIRAQNFMNKCYSEIFDQEVMKRINDRTKLETDYDEMDDNNLLTAQARGEIIKIGKFYRTRQMLVTRSTKGHNPPTIRFDFIETRKGYRLYCIDHHWFKKCCEL